MVYIVKDFTQESLTNLLEEIKRKRKKETLVAQSFDESESQESVRSEWKRKNVAKYFGCLKWDMDGVEYQRMVRNEWD